MASTYPGALDSIAANKTNATVAIDDHAPHHNDLADAINAVQTALGVNLGNVVSSNTAGVTGADAITNMLSLTQAEYDAITPNASTVYVIVG